MGTTEQIADPSGLQQSSMPGIHNPLAGVVWLASCLRSANCNTGVAVHPMAKSFAFQLSCLEYLQAVH